MSPQRVHQRTLSIGLGLLVGVITGCASVSKPMVHLGMTDTDLQARVLDLFPLGASRATVIERVNANGQAIAVLRAEEALARFGPDAVLPQGMRPGDVNPSPFFEPPESARSVMESGPIALCVAMWVPPPSPLPIIYRPVYPARERSLLVMEFDAEDRVSSVDLTPIYPRFHAARGLDWQLAQSPTD